MTNIDPKWGSWVTPIDTVPEEEILSTEEADVIVIGAGIAGVTCALRAAQCVSSVIVLEKTASWSARGGNIGVANSSFMKEKGYENNLEFIAREWIKRCGNRCDERIVWQYLKNGGRAMDWLIDIVTKPEYGACPALQGCVYKGDTYVEVVGAHRFFDGPMAKRGARAGAADAVYAMFTEAEQLGVRFLFCTPAEQFVKKDGCIEGVVAKDKDGYRYFKARRGVVIATGDIGGNDEMCADLSPLANRCSAKVYAPRGGNTGDGHRMGLWAGGSFEDTPFPAVLHPQAYQFGNYCFLFVRPDGMRFMNEDNYVQGKSVAIIRERIPYAWSILDSDWAEKIPATLPYGGGLFWGQDCIAGEKPFEPDTEAMLLEWGLKRGVAVKANTPEELAVKMDVPAAVFAATFQRYNELVSKGCDEDFGKRRELLLSLDKPPYIALKFGPALLAVVGGLRVDTTMCVLDEKGGQIPGLYAIGNAAGGRYGVDYPILIAGNSHGTALTFGFLLGEQLGSMYPAADIKA